MTDTLIQPRTITVHPTDLLEAACVALENETVQQCKGHMRRVEYGEVMHCAEGVIAQVLINAYPKVYAWDGLGHLHNRQQHLSSCMLEPADWNRLHPEGAAISHRAADLLGAGSIAGANDNAGASFAEVAAALRQARVVVESWRTC